MIIFVTVLCIFMVCTPLLLKYWIKQRSRNLLPHLKKNSKGEKCIVVGFFHPYCNAGGGGERVLWSAVRALHKNYSRMNFIIYTGDADTNGTDILKKARERFNIDIDFRVEFVFLKKRHWVEAEKYPLLTLLGQSLGSVILGWEALLSYVPDIYIDSMGYAFTLPVFKYLGGCKTVSYVHYPTISTDMLQRVSERTQTYNNAGFISRSVVLSFIKLQYYKLFAWLYGVMGRRSDRIMVNSTWTYNHIKQLWQVPDKTYIVYPPCDVSEFMKIQLHKQQSVKWIISISQFRPEKDHKLQIRSFSTFIKSQLDNKDAYRLLLVGSCRNQADLDRVQELKDLCNSLDVEKYIEFKLNVSFAELKDLMSQSTIGLHTMWNEHFGIGVVELMAAGTIILAHNSGGPKLDIVKDYNNKKTGFLADTETSYAEAISDIFKMTDEERLQIRTNARQSVQRFGEDKFEEHFLSVCQYVINI